MEAPSDDLASIQDAIFAALDRPDDFSTSNASFSRLLDTSNGSNAFYTAVLEGADVFGGSGAYGGSAGDDISQMLAPELRYDGAGHDSVGRQLSDRMQGLRLSERQGGASLLPDEPLGVATEVDFGAALAGDGEQTVQKQKLKRMDRSLSISSRERRLRGSLSQQTSDADADAHALVNDAQFVAPDIPLRSSASAAPAQMQTVHGRQFVHQRAKRELSDQVRENLGIHERASMYGAGAAAAPLGTAAPKRKVQRMRSKSNNDLRELGAGFVDPFSRDDSSAHAPLGRRQTQNMADAAQFSLSALDLPPDVLRAVMGAEMGDGVEPEFGEMDDGSLFPPFLRQPLARKRSKSLSDLTRGLELPPAPHAPAPAQAWQGQPAFVQQSSMAGPMLVSAMPVYAAGQHYVAPIMLPPGQVFMQIPSRRSAPAVASPQVASAMAAMSPGDMSSPVPSSPLSTTSIASDDTVSQRSIKPKKPQWVFKHENQDTIYRDGADVAYVQTLPSGIVLRDGREPSTFVQQLPGTTFVQHPGVTTYVVQGRDAFPGAAGYVVDGRGGVVALADATTLPATRVVHAHPPAAVIAPPSVRPVAANGPAQAHSVAPAPAATAPSTAAANASSSRNWQFEMQTGLEKDQKMKEREMRRDMKKRGEGSSTAPAPYYFPSAI